MVCQVRAISGGEETRARYRAGFEGENTDQLTARFLVVETRALRRTQCECGANAVSPMRLLTQAHVSI